jgi:hypothetical protein
VVARLFPKEANIIDIKAAGDAAIQVDRTGIQ